MDPSEAASLLLIYEKAGEHGDRLRALQEAALKRLIEIDKALPRSRKQDTQAHA